MFQAGMTLNYHTLASAATSKQSAPQDDENSATSIEQLDLNVQ